MTGYRSSVIGEKFPVISCYRLPITDHLITDHRSPEELENGGYIFVFDSETGYYQKKAHTYCCEDCNYRWKVETDLGETDDEEISLDYEDSFDGPFSWVCPMCGSSYVSEI